MKKTLTGWRVCVGTGTPETGFKVKPLYPNSEQQAQPAIPKQPLSGTHHVGTTKKFVIDYYTGLVTLQANEFELMLRLDCTGKIKPQDEERWEWPVGTEAITQNPIVIEIEILDRGPRE